MFGNNIFKKSISPLIATILIVLISVVLIAGIVSFSKDFTTGNLDESSVIKYDSSLLNGFIESTSVYENTSGELSKIVLKNNNSQKDLNVVSYKIIDSDATNTTFLDTVYDLNTSVVVSTGSSNQIEIKCVPSKDFTLELITSDGEYVKVPVSYVGASLSSCDNAPYCGDGTCNGDETVSSCGQDCIITYFSSTWNTALTSTGSSESNQITLPLVSDGNYDFTIDWGDGSTSEITSFSDSDKTHTYASSGIYDLNMLGTIQGWSFNYTGDRLKLTNISQWGDLRLGATDSHFQGCQNLTITATDILDLTGTISLNESFHYNLNLTNIPNINQWDVSDINNLNSTFYYATIFNSDISDWNISNVTDMEYMFRSARKFNSALNDWDVSNVTNMHGTFMEAYVFNQPLNNWDVSNVTNMSYMFNQAKVFNQDLNDWNLASVTNVDVMFGYALDFDGNIFSWQFPNVTSLYHMFGYAYDFNQDVSGWEVSNISNFNNMFENASSFNQDISGWDVSSGNSFDQMFYNASSFNQPLNDWDMSSATSINAMFRGISYNQPLNNWDVSNVTSMSGVFYNNSSFNQPLADWNTSNVTVNASMFYGASSFNQDISNWDVSNVTNMIGIFQNASSFNQDISGWDTSSITSTSWLFNGATNFNQDLSAWDVSSATSTYNPFASTSISAANCQAISTSWGYTCEELGCSCT